jgi:diguanylate cyclase (GGDEF)-like protein/PAS domain S-box-containing protein
VLKRAICWIQTIVMAPLIAGLADRDWGVLALAAMFCFATSVVAINLFHRAQITTGRVRLVRLCLVAAVAALGFWATDFIAIAAYSPGIVAGYDIGLLILSVVVGALITGFGVAVALLDFAPWAMALGGVIVGCGIAASNYAGMVALQVSGRVAWSPGLVAISVSFAAVFAGLAFFIASRRQNWATTIVGGGLLTFATVGTFLIGASAASLVPELGSANGTVRLWSTSQSLIIIGAATVILVMCLVEMASSSQAQSELRSEKYLLDTALQNMRLGLCMFESDGRIILFNDHYAGLMGIPPTDLKGLSLLDIFKLRKASGPLNGDPDEQFQSVLADAREGRSSTYIIETRPGSWVRVSQQPIQDRGWVSIVEDVSEWRRAQAQIVHMERHDKLTDLPNRMVFREQLELALSRISRTDGEVAVHCLDLDNFKVINDALGHPTGDDLLKSVALRLNAGVRDTDCVARLGGDQFGIVQVSQQLPASEVASFAARLIELVSIPYAIRGHPIVISASIGISIAPADGIDPDALLKDAEIALYRAKEEGRGSYRFFERGMDAFAQARRQLELDMRTAMVRNEFEIYYQPIYNIETLRVVGFEALVRWNHPLRGIVLPGAFIPLAEETGLIVPLGNWVLRRACQDAAGWSREVAVAVNLSPAQFRDRKLVASITAILSDSSLAANRLELEITESIFLKDSQATLETMHGLRDLGIRISMDDFGTGYSSLNYLRSFPFDKIKIDASFVHELASRNDSMAIVRAVTGLATSLGITTTAEGVETNEQLALLRAEGCNEVQGYLFNPPRPATEVENMLIAGRSGGTAPTHPGGSLP